MGRREKSEEYRLQILREFQNPNSEAKPPEVLEAEKVIAKFRKKEEEDRLIKARLGLPLPQEDACPECFYLHGRTSVMRPVSSSKPRHETYRCGECGTEIEAEA